MRYFDAHCDTITCLYDNKKELYENNLHISIKKAKNFDEYLQMFAIWVDENYCKEEPFTYVKNVYNNFLAQVKKNEKHIEICTNKLQLNEKNGKIKGILTIEGGCGVGSDENNVSELAKMGFKIITITWNGENELAYGCFAKENGGIKPFGKSVLAKMRDEKMLCDVSHLNERGFFEVADMGNSIIATHSNAKSVCNHVRNLTDEQFKVLVSQKSGAGINLYTKFIGDNPNITQIIKHIEHFMSLGGENSIFIGADFDGCDTIAGGIKDVSGVGILQSELLRLNYSETLVDKIFYKNLKTIMEEKI